MENNYIESFLEMMAAERGASSNTISSYKRDLLDFSAYITKKDKDLSVTAIDLNLLKSYISSLSEAGLSAATVARRISGIKQFFQFLYSDGIIKDNPAVNLESPKKASSLPKYLDENEVKILIDTAHADKSKDGIRLAALLEILYASGLRVTELIKLKTTAFQKKMSHGDDVVFLNVRGKGNKERVVPLNPAAIDSLMEYLRNYKAFLGRNEKSDWLFPSRGKEGHLTRQRLGQMLKDLAIKAGIDPEKVSPHVLRHSFASHLLSNGMDLRMLQELLGHSDISTTQVYTHISNKKLKSLVEEKHPLAKKKAS